MKNRKGSFTVSIVLIFSSMLVLVLAVLSAAGNLAVSSTADHFGRLWGTSILAEYDLNLKDRYGLFGFYGDKASVEKKLNYYAGYTYGEKSYIDYGGASCSLKHYSLADPAVIKKQMADAVLYGNRPHGLVKHENPQSAGSKQEGTGSSAPGSRTITSGWILENLPSRGNYGDTDLTSLVSEIKNGKGISSLIGTSSVNQYIFTYFRHNRSTEAFGETYFLNEIEYILTGRADDEGARKKVRQKLVVMRNLLNLAYLYSSPEKREIAMALAAALTPGPEAVLTQGILLELWAYGEAENDVRMLEAGQKVPLLKSDRTWALTLENAMNQEGAEEESGPEASRKQYVAPSSMEGLHYGEYLRVFLSALPEETRILRAMDLIQINMKYLYCDYFLLKDYYTGLKFTMNVNGVEHEFEETYERASEPEGQLSG